MKINPFSEYRPQKYPSGGLLLRPYQLITKTKLVFTTSCRIGANLGHTGTKVVTKVPIPPGVETSLAPITEATASDWEKYCWFNTNVIICHRKPIWFSSLKLALSAAHQAVFTHVVFIQPPWRERGGNRHLMFSSLWSHTLGKVKIWLVYTKYLAALEDNLSVHIKQ